MTNTLTTPKTWADVRDIVNEQAKLNFDFYASPSKIRMGDDGTVLAVDNDRKVHELGFTDIGLAQFATKVGIPSQYAAKLATIDKTLLATNFNTMLKENIDPHKDLLVRGTQKPSGPCLRAVLSDRYGILDNNEFVGAVADAFIKTGIADRVKIESLSIGDRSFHIRLTEEGGKLDALQRAKVFQQAHDLGKMGFTVNGEKHDFLYPMLHLSNSEVGSASIKLEGGVYRVVCTNGLVAPVASDTTYRRRHFGFSQNDLNEYVVAKAAEILNGAKGFTTKFAESQSEKIENPEDLLEKLVSKHRITKTNEKSIRDELGLTTSGVHANEITKYDVVNAMTATARDLKDFDARVDLERIAATLISRN